MKLNGILLVAALVGSLAAGCKSSNSNNSAPTDSTPEAVAPEENIDNAPVEDPKAPGVEKDARHFHYYAPHAPPAPRHEVWGARPGPHHTWAPGYYRWTGRDYSWYDGRWVAPRPDYDYVGPRWVAVGPRYEYLPGRWVRRY